MMTSSVDDELDILISRMAVLIQKNAQSMLSMPTQISAVISPNSADRYCRLCFQLVNFPSRALNIKIILQWPSFRISEHRVRVSALQEIVARRHLKIVFFGRTSSGKSSAINALLGDKILPTGESETDSSMYLHNTWNVLTFLMRCNLSWGFWLESPLCFIPMTFQVLVTPQAASWMFVVPMPHSQAFWYPPRMAAHSKSAQSKYATHELLS